MTEKFERRRRKAERPQEILKAALEVFSEKGFAATRLDDIAIRAGVTKGTIYVYFESKEELFVATVKEQSEPVFQHLIALLEHPDGSALEILRQHLLFAAKQVIEDPRGCGITRIILTEGHRFPAVVDRWYIEVLGPALKAMGDILQYGVDRGEFRPTAMQNFPQLVMAPVILCHIWQGLFGDRRALDIKNAIEASLDVFAKGLEIRTRSDQID
jgi:AcrR family transcriptional regulator